MDAFVEIFKYSLPLVGVGVGWLFNQLSERYKLAREDRKKIKRTIFYLLEVRHQLTPILASESEIDMYIATYKRTISHLLNEADGLELEKQLKPVIKKLAKKNPFYKDLDIENLNNKINECIDTLSEIDPILAFKLNGKHNIREAINVLHEQSQAVVTKLSNDIKDLEEFKNLFTVMEPNLVRDTTSDLDFIVLQLAKMVDDKTLKDVEERVKVFQAPADPVDMTMFVNKIFEGVFGDHKVEGNNQI